MGEKTLFSRIQILITSPLFPISTTLLVITIMMHEKKNNREKTLLYPAMIRTTQPTINTSDSVAK
jgi:hypothetical protein